MAELMCVISCRITTSFTVKPSHLAAFLIQLPFATKTPSLFSVSQSVEYFISVIISNFFIFAFHASRLRHGAIYTNLFCFE